MPAGSPYRLGLFQVLTHRAAAQAGAAGSLNPERGDYIARYFRQLYRTIDTDPKDVQGRRRDLVYPEVSNHVRMIGDDTESVVVPYGSRSEQARVQQLLAQLRAGTPAAHYIMRELQAYLVSIRVTDAEKYRSNGLIAEITDGLGEWLGNYDSIRGWQH